MYKTTGKLTILENCVSNLILGNYSLTLLRLFILIKALFFPCHSEVFLVFTFETLHEPS